MSLLWGVDQPPLMLSLQIFEDEEKKLMTDDWLEYLEELVYLVLDMSHCPNKVALCRDLEGTSSLLVLCELPRDLRQHSCKGHIG
jgi:hypothetical protein